MSLFQKATKKKAKLKIALTGPSGSGKTFSALRIAKGIGGKVAVVDTENGSASLYADRFDFDTAAMSPPYLTNKYLRAINEAVSAGYDVLVIDSISHAWAGEGGILRRKDALDAGGKGNSYTNWNRFTPEHEQFIATILHAPIHIIATMRSKQEYILTDVGGKQVPKKVGMAPVQRDGVEYEFTAVLDLGMNHMAETSKDRTSLFGGRVFQPTEETGQELLEWINGGSDEPDPEPPKTRQLTRSTEPTKPAQKSTESTKPVDSAPVNQAPVVPAKSEFTDLQDKLPPGEVEPAGAFAQESGGPLVGSDPVVSSPEPQRHPADFQFQFGTKRKNKWASDFGKAELEMVWGQYKKQDDKGKLSQRGKDDLLALDRYLMEVYPESDEQVSNGLPEGGQGQESVGQDLRQQSGTVDGSGIGTQGKGGGNRNPSVPGPSAPNGSENPVQA